MSVPVEIVISPRLGMAKGMCSLPLSLTARSICTRGPSAEPARPRDLIQPRKIGPISGLGVMPLAGSTSIRINARGIRSSRASNVVPDGQPGPSPGFAGTTGKRCRRLMGSGRAYGQPRCYR